MVDEDKIEHIILHIGDDPKTFLEYQYNASQWEVNKASSQEVLEKFERIGLKAREKLIKNTTCDLDIEYTCGKNTKLDIYYPGDSKTAKHDVLIFIHGGYWQEGSKDYYVFLASQAKAFNTIVVVPAYDLAPDESIGGMVKQMKCAILFIAEKFPDSRLFLCGHSAGAHLSAMMLNTSWDDCNMIKNRLNGMCLISGVYDLVPLIPTSINVKLKLDKETAMQISPMTLATSQGLKLQHCKVLVAVGEDESAEFQRQAKEYYQLIKGLLTNVTFLEVPGVSHFNIMEKCLEKDFTLVKAICNFIKDKE